MKKTILLLEGGAFRTLYTAGVLDVFMEHDLWLDTAGVSGGALNGANYISRQPDRARILNLAHRHDSRYVGTKALKEEHGLIGFDYMFHGLNDAHPFDEDAFFASPQRFVAVTTCCETGRPVYFDRDEVSREDAYRALAASSSLPIISKPVKIGNCTYLDGGLSDSVPLHWAMKEGYEKIIVVRTRDRAYRKPAESAATLAMYRARFPLKPLLLEDLSAVSTRYNAMCQELEELEQEGKIFTIAPETPVTVTRLENDLTKLQALYNEGRRETEARWQELLDYLE